MNERYIIISPISITNSKLMVITTAKMVLFTLLYSDEIAPFLIYLLLYLFAIIKYFAGMTKFGSGGTP